MTEEDQAKLLLTALNEAIAPAVAYEYGKVPGTNGVAGALPAQYLLIDLSRRYVGDRHASGEVTIPGGRVGTRYVAKSIGNARKMRQAATALLEDKVISSDGLGELGPFLFESSESIDEDSGGYVSGADVWTF